ncbi:MAG TPA: hypothetical protein VFA11_17670 [Acidimicrobiales bacterium]|nr:hypothetical protein [Acidimicrobiales bacterium]
MATSLLYLPIHRHVSAWLTPGDLWATVQAAHFIAWGDLGGVYSSSAHLVSLPGFPLLMAPFAFVAWHFNLSESWPIALQHPTAWLLFGPFAFLAAGATLFGADALAESLGASRRARWWLGLGAAAVVFPGVLISGHPEDPLALGLALYGLRAASTRRWTATAWLMGAALAVQPFTVLLVPAVLGAAGAGRLLPLLLRAALLPGFLTIVVLAADRRAAFDALFRQPNYPGPDHPTPWVALAPRLSATSVAAGPGRMIALLVALALGFWVAKSRRPQLAMVAAAFLALAGRCAFESVLNPYYMTPALVVAMILAARRGPACLAPCSLLALGLTVLGYFHMGQWEYWAMVVSVLAAVGCIGLARSGAASTRPVLALVGRT